jgi:threonine dehydrogenase-like Zn-dependent dehydrogenase
VVAALRATGFAGLIDVVARRGRLGGVARDLGADELLVLPRSRAGRFARIAQRTGATVHRVRFGNRMLSGGYDVVFECVGTAGSVSESLKWARARGQVVLVGTAGGGADLTSVWFRELRVLGAYGRQVEQVGGRRVGTYQLVHELMAAGTLRTAGLLTHTFRLADYRRALAVGLAKSRHGAIKVAFDFR